MQRPELGTGRTASRKSACTDRAGLSGAAGRGAWGRYRERKEEIFLILFDEGGAERCTVGVERPGTKISVGAQEKHA